MRTRLNGPGEGSGAGVCGDGKDELAVDWRRERMDGEMLIDSEKRRDEDERMLGRRTWVVSMAGRELVVEKERIQIHKE